MQYYAHSGNAVKGIKPQTYKSHVRNVEKMGLLNVKKSFKNSTFSEDTINFVVDALTLAARYHDMGKLDPHIQSVLSSSISSNNRLLNHVDAGVAYLLKKFRETNHTAYLIAAFFVLSHHIGLQNWFEYVDELKPEKLFAKIVYALKDLFRCNYNLKEKYGINIDTTLKFYTDSMMNDYVKIQHSLLGEYTPVSKGDKIPLTSLQIRIVFSCLIDADHQDTANHFSKKQYTIRFPSLKPKQRSNQLDRAVQQLKKSKRTSSVKGKMRSQLFDLCSKIPTDRQYYLIDATVGSAKTVAAIKAALRIAETRGQERIYSVAPFTNIINQTVDVYKKSILLPNEKSYAINEIHSKVEFEDPQLRMYNNLWNAPINVTTAVQFVESLVRHTTSSIRKLHLFANSVVILDEFHNFIPHELWNYILELMQDLAQNFNTVFLFSSGSSVFYWDLYEKSDIDVFEIVPSVFYKKMLDQEKKRVKIIRHQRPIESLDEVSNLVFETIQKNDHRSAMIVLNTIKNAIALTKHFIALNTEFEIYHISSYLTPKDRKIILDKIKSELGTRKIILIATSIVECGVDMSFECGFRQNSSLSSVLQFNGRINREQSYKSSTTTIFDFHPNLKTDKIVTENPTFVIGKKVLNSLTDKQLTPEYCTETIAMELEQRNRLNDPDYFLRMDTSKCFKTIGEEFHVISSHTITVIVDPTIINSIRNQEYVSYRDITNNSVQLWFTKLEDPRFISNIEAIKIGDKQHYFWIGSYNTLFGIGVDL